MEAAVKRWELDAPIDRFVSTVIQFYGLICALCLASAALFTVTQLGSTRCWSNAGLPEDGISNVKLVTGSGVGNKGFVEFSIQYALPFGTLERVQLHGPIRYGVAAPPTPAALTLCSPEAIQCTDMEVETCLREGVPVGCGRIINKAKKLSPLDSPVVPGGRIYDLTQMLEHNPQDFYINVTSSLKPSGVHRGLMGTLCPL
jgi:hypothetical protein